MSDTTRLQRTRGKTLEKTVRRNQRTDALQTTQGHGTTGETRCEMVGRLLARIQHACRRTHCVRQSSSDDVPPHPEASLLPA